ncbi:EF-Hand 1, calcium-binding site [Phytophthora cactorum]|nr:EF-Hand 1, calcium-binding site [Phytophthora cactorum]
MPPPRLVELSVSGPLLFPRYVDADSLHTEDEDADRVVRNQSVLRVADLLGVPTSSLASRKQCGSPRTAAFTAPLVPESPSLFGSDHPSPFTKKKRAASPRVSSMSPLNVLPRAPSPVGELPTDSVISFASLMSPPSGVMGIRSPRRAILGQSDVHKINKWLQSLSHEAASFSSYALYCDMLFRESRVLTQGKPVPNRLQTAIAFHCLCKATSVFARHEGILLHICNDLGAAIYMNHDPSLIRNGEIDALEFFTRLTTFYEQHTVFHQQKQDLQQEILRQQTVHQQRLEQERARNEQLKQLHQQLQVNKLDTISTKKTHAKDLNGKLQNVLLNFQYVNDQEKEKIVLGAIEALQAQVSATAVVAIADQMDPVEKDKLMSNLLQDKMMGITQQIEEQVLVKSNAQQNMIIERSAARITRFQALMLDVIKNPNSGEARKENSTAELEREKKNSTSLEQKLEEAEKLANELRLKNNSLMNEAEERARKYEQQLQEMKDQIVNAQNSTDDKSFQTDEDFEELRRHNETDSDDDLILKNRAKNKFGYGIANIIDQAKIAPSKVRKILLKRKPLTLNELHSIIVGYYQAKMFQDVQDDSSGKPRTNLAQFIMEMYVLHYGLKDLAISQLVFLDAAIRKNARESARVRTFGLLTGSLDPESHACSSKASISSYCSISAGVYKKGRKQAVTIAQNLKTFFGDGIFVSPKSVTVKHELVCQAIDLAFSQLKDEIHQRCLANGGGLDIDMVLEKIMNYWFVLYEHQIQDIHNMFTIVDTNGDGTLDFQEFCELVAVLEPTMDRRDALALYNRAAGEDNVIDKDEFVQVMLAHQRGVILEEFYGGVSNKKILMGIEQRKNTLLPLGSSTTTSQEKEEGSFDLLTAAMASVSMTSESLEDDDEEDKNEDDKTETQRVQENVSFQALSRLSTWATEAKRKLRRAIPRTLASTKEEERTVARESSPDDFQGDTARLLRQALQNANISAHSPTE